MVTTIRRVGVSIFILFGLAAAGQAGGDEFSPPNYVPEMRLSYLDPQSGERVSCEEECRRFEVPAGVDLEIAIGTKDSGADPDGHGVPWDLFFDQRNHPFPGLKASDCQDASGETDIDCWLALMKRVDWDTWNSVVPDRVCVPEKAGECAEVLVRVGMDENFEGSRGRGVYSFAVWADRFQIAPESDEFDNFIGPVRVKVIPRVEGPGTPETALPVEEAEDPGVLVVAPSVPMPYHFRTAPKKLEKAFNLSSPSSKAVIDFVPSYPGEVEVEVDTGGRSLDKLVIEVLSYATGRVLAETTGKGRINLQGTLTQVDLKNDRRIEVKVSLAQGARPTRGSLIVHYPAEAMYRRWD